MPLACVSTAGRRLGGSERGPRSDAGREWLAVDGAGDGGGTQSGAGDPRAPADDPGGAGEQGQGGPADATQRREGHELPPRHEAQDPERARDVLRGSRPGVPARRAGDDPAHARDPGRAPESQGWGGGNRLADHGARYRCTTTDDPCPNNPWFAVTPSFAPSTWRSPASPRSCQASSQTWAIACAGTASPKQERPPLGLTGM